MRVLDAIKGVSIVEAVVLVLAASCSRPYGEDVDTPLPGRDAMSTDPEIVDVTTDGGIVEPPPDTDATVDASRPDAVEGPTILSPYEPSNTLTYERPIDWTLAGFNPSTTIFFTTDGGPPSLKSTPAIGSVSFTALADGSTIRWRTGPNDPARSFKVKVDPALKNGDHYIIQRLAFDLTKGPVVRVSAGASVTGTVSYTVWSGSYCPGCIIQLKLGTTAPQTCIHNGGAGVYPGVSKDNVTFTIQAPSTPGTYELKTGFDLQYNCADALNGGLSTISIGTIIVE